MQGYLNKYGDLVYHNCATNTILSDNNVYFGKINLSFVLLAILHEQFPHLGIMKYTHQLGIAGNLYSKEFLIYHFGRIG